MIESKVDSSKDSVSPHGRGETLVKTSGPESIFGRDFSRHSESAFLMLETDDSLGLEPNFDNLMENDMKRFKSCR